MRRSDLAAYARRVAEASRKARSERTSQIVFGERQYLLRVLDSVERTTLSQTQRRQEQQFLERMIYDRTQELNRMNTGWDEKVGRVLRPDVTAEELACLEREAPDQDHFLLRIISEHPRANAETLARLARHSYTAIRENVARHPNASPETLEELCRDTAQPLWYLVAYNPGAPPALRQRLLRQVKQMSRRGRAK